MPRFEKNQKELAFDLGMPQTSTPDAIHERLETAVADLTKVQQVGNFRTDTNTQKFFKKSIDEI